MKRVMNRMAEVETREPAQEDVETPAPEKRKEGHCPKCGKSAGLISERRQNNRVLRQYRCEPCDIFFTSEA